MSFQDIARGREQQGFVGRGGELARFRANLALPVTDPDRRFVFSIHGDGGVGKSTLLRELQRIAAESGAVCAAADERAIGVPETLQVLADQVARQGVRLPGFTKLYAAYLQSRTAVGRDPGAPEGWAGLATQTAVKAGSAAAHVVPVPGAGIVADAVDGEALGRQVDRLAGRSRRQRQAQLLAAPVDALSAALVADMERLGGRTLALFFDTFEQTSAVLDPWLRALLDGRYGPLPAELVVTIAGRAPVDQAAWAPLLGVLVDTALGPFTEIEARQLLAGRGVSDEEAVREILDNTGRLPLLVAIYAQGGNAAAVQARDLSGDAVERFVTGLDPGQRALVLAAALPRSVDEDVLGVVVRAAGQSGDPETLFASLRSREFVTHDAGVCRYHELVRAPMLVQARRQSRARWRAIHAALAEYHRVLRGDGPADWDSDEWRDAYLEEFYHRLCANPQTLAHALEAMVHACVYGIGTARHWAQMIAHAGRDTASSQLIALGRRLEAGVAGGESEATIGYLGVLLERNTLTPGARALALRTRGRAQYLFGHDSEALDDFDHSVALAPDDALALAQRADTLRFLGRYGDAYADLDRAFELDPDSVWALGVRGMLHRNTGRRTEALADFNRALALDPNLAWVWARRGQTYRDLGQLKEALADFDRALELKPGIPETIGDRGSAYLATGQRDLALRALADLDLAVEADPRNPSPLVQRAMLHRQIDQFEQSLADFNRALELNPASEWATAGRGETYRFMGRLPEALADFDRAVELNPVSDWTIASRGQVYQAMGRREEALAEYERALEINPDLTWVIIERGEAYRLAERLPEALADFNRALEVNPDGSWELASRGQVHRELGRREEALADFDRALELDPGLTWVTAERGQLYRVMDRYQEALADLDRLLDLDPDYAWARAERGMVHLLTGILPVALTEFSRAVELRPDYAWAITGLGHVHQGLKQFPEALADYERALEINPDQTWALAGRGETYRLTRRFPEALADFDRAIELDPAYAWAIGSRGQVYRALDRLPEALADFRRAHELDPGLIWVVVERDELSPPAA